MNSFKKRIIRNQDIKFDTLRVIGSDRTTLGVMSKKEALVLADSEDLDLILIVEKAEPPVARIVDLNKYIYEQQKNEKLTFLIKDEGLGFDYENLPDPTDPKNIEKPDGRGIYLMKHLSDSISFEDNGSSIELSFELSAN